MKNIKLILMVCLALMLIALAACSTPAASTSAFPTGKFVDAKNEYAGYYFNEDMTWSYFVYGEIGAEGKYSVKNNRWTEEGTKECPFPGTYEWSFDGTNLTFKLVGEDKCDPRREATDGQTFVLAKEMGTGAAENSMSEIKVDAADFSYSAPETVNAGWVQVTLTNSGQEPHHVQFLRLNDGVTVTQFEEALKQGEGPALAMTRQVGGVGAVAPGMSAQAVLNLPAGEYVILCLIPSPSDQVAHHAKGMIKSLTVQAGSNPASEPQADLTVHMADFKYDLPESLPAGPLTIQVVNDGPEPHEFNLLKLPEGKTVNDVIQFLNGAGGPPPFIPVGGMNGLDKGLSGYAKVNLEPGTYVAICNIPSPKAEGHPHFALGMVKEFTVGAEASSNFPTGKFIKAGTTDEGLIFNADGTWSRFNNVFIDVSGTYSVNGNVYTETSEDGGCEPNVSFTYTFDGKNLTFNYVGNPEEDRCVNRTWDFNNVTYTLAEE